MHPNLELFKSTFYNIKTLECLEFSIIGRE